MWTAPFGKGFFDMRTGWSAAVICPACWRGAFCRWPLMKSDEPRSLIIAASLTLMTIRGVSLAFGGDHCRSSRLVCARQILDR
jgi:hypothetical protein